MQARSAIIVAIAAASSQAQAWNYDAQKDQMTGKTNREAVVLSENDTDLGWPYGKTDAKILVRQHPRYGRDVIFAVRSGQMPCSSYSPCRVIARFDDNKPMTFSAVGPSDNSSNTLFIQGYDRFVKALEKSKRVIIEAEFYKAGNRQFRFDTEGFSAKKLAEAKAY